MEKEQKGTVSQLLEFAGTYRGLTVVGCTLSAVAMAVNMVPYAFVWLVVRDLVSVAPNWTEASEIERYGWWALAAAIAGIVIYFLALMCTHLTAFRTAANIRKRCMAHLAKAPLGYFDTHASGLLRRRIDGAAGQTETLLAHNLADITGTIAMFIALLALLLFFDWRMGASCLLAAIISIGALFAMMGGKNASLMTEYYDALDRASKAGTEYVRGIPVVKVFQQTVYSFRAFKAAIDDYYNKASYYQGKVCKGPQAVNLTVTEGAFVFLVPVALLVAPASLAEGTFAVFVTNFAFYAIFSAVMSTALAKIMFAAGGLNQAGDALRRINEVLDAPTLPIADNPQSPVDNSINFEDVSFTYEGTDCPALDHLSFSVEPGQLVALVGPSGGGKTTAASLIPRFWDADSGTASVGGVDVRQMDPRDLMDHMAFVFQNTRLFSASILDNVRAARPDATREQALEALHAAQCDDILAKLPEGADTIIGSAGTYLSGGEQQRVALARAILKDAPIVVLDEATAFADPENEALIQRAFERLLAGRTVVMIAHRLSTVVDADRIVVLDAGRVEEQGTHAELVHAKGLYARMWADYQRSVQWKIEREVA